MYFAGGDSFTCDDGVSFALICALLFFVQVFIFQAVSLFSEFVKFVAPNGQEKTQYDCDDDVEYDLIGF